MRGYVGPKPRGGLELQNGVPVSSPQPDAPVRTKVSGMVPASVGRAGLGSMSLPHPIDSDRDPMSESRRGRRTAVSTLGRSSKGWWQCGKPSRSAARGPGQAPGAGGLHSLAFQAASANLSETELLLSWILKLVTFAKPFTVNETCS